MMTTTDIGSVHEKFITLFASDPLTVYSPGHVNIIGEHTGYNEGFVLPVIIDKGVSVAIGKREDDAIHLYSEEFTEHHITDLSSI